jgi:hypothetical protein
MVALGMNPGAAWSWVPWEIRRFQDVDLLWRYDHEPSENGSMDSSED